MVTFFYTFLYSIGWMWILCIHSHILSFMRCKRRRRKKEWKENHLHNLMRTVKSENPIKLKTLNACWFSMKLIRIKRLLLYVSFRYISYFNAKNFSVLFLSSFVFKHSKYCWIAHTFYSSLLCLSFDWKKFNLTHRSILIWNLHLKISLKGIWKACTKSVSIFIDHTEFILKHLKYNHIPI